MFPIKLKHEIKPGIVQINLDERRWYAAENEDGTTDYFPSVTTILDAYPKGIGFKRWLMALADEQEGNKILNDAGDRGSKVHWGIEQLLQNKTLNFSDIPFGYTEQFNANEWKYILTFINWYEIFEPLTLSLEQTIINDEFGFAGTVDIICEIDEGLLLTYNPRSKKPPIPSGNKVRVLLDWKTSANIYETAKIQVYAYAKTVGAIDYVGVVKLGHKSKTGFEFWINEIDAPDGIDYFDLFLATFKIWKNENRNIHPRFMDCPEKLSLLEDEDA